VLQTTRDLGQGQLSKRDAARSVGLMIGTAAVVAFSYFLAARLGLALLTEEGVAVFWPASGVAAGILIARGPNARLSVAIGVIVATVAANLMADRSLWAALAKSGCNAGEALLVAWLIERSFGHPFVLDGLRRTIGFFIAATIGAAIAGVGGAAAMSLFHKAGPFVDIWRTWFLAGELGIVTIAPLLIGIASPARKLPPGRELTEGTAALVALAVTATFIFSMPPGSWLTFVPVLAVFPLLLWIAARSQWVLAAAAVFIVASACVWEATFGQDRFGTSSLPISERIYVAQAEMFITTLCALVLAALFAERRRSEDALRESHERLQLALDGAQLGAFSSDIATGRLECDARTAHVHGHKTPPPTLNEGRRFVHPDDRERIDTAFAEALRTGGTCKAEYRVVYPPDHPQAGEVRWITFEGSIVRDAQGQPVRLLSVIRDNTEKKRAEEHQKLLIAELDHRVKNVLAAVAAVLQRTREGSASMDEFLSAIDGRIRSMADTHALLSRGRWQGVNLAHLVRQELAPCVAAANTTVEGPDILLTADAAQAVALVLHELVTNAAKYGALSSQKGHVSVQWDQRANGDVLGELVIDWKEDGGPPVPASISSGYGTSVIKEFIPYELGGVVDLVFAPEGVRCRLEIPGKWLNYAL
jgi:two-component sensor histidine kinase/PAS domain-containing protein